MLGVVYWTVLNVKLNMLTVTPLQRCSIDFKLFPYYILLLILPQEFLYSNAPYFGNLTPGLSASY